MRKLGRIEVISYRSRTKKNFLPLTYANYCGSAILEMMDMFNRANSVTCEFTRCTEPTEGLRSTSAGYVPQYPIIRRVCFSLHLYGETL